MFRQFEMHGYRWLCGFLNLSSCLIFLNVCVLCACVFAIELRGRERRMDAVLIESNLESVGKDPCNPR